MKQYKGTLWLAVAAALLSPSKARAQGKATARAASGGPPQRQGRRQITRRPQALAPMVSPCGRHVVEVAGGKVLIDGRRVRSADDDVFVIAPPTWRGDGSALAWIERSRGEARLVVVPDLDGAPIRSPGRCPRCRRTTASSGRATGASSSGRPSSRRARSRPGPSREPLSVFSSLTDDILLIIVDERDAWHVENVRPRSRRHRACAFESRQFCATRTLRDRNARRRSTCGTGISHLPQRR